ncbi:MAG: hypothetical protein EKK42_20440 [Pseudonocardiaceae bacterium]|nr:MAG: hypothetical protein EKK42_20440 [Pseudonocardiaceae bacterium]
MAGISGPRIGRTLGNLPAQGDRDFKWRTLDARGYQGPIPEFPLPEIRARESDLWLELWRTPQAIEWKRLNLVRQVALYVRKSVDTEMPDTKAADMLTLRQMTDSLGLSIPGMRAHRWRISEDETPDEFEDEAPEDDADVPDIRDR